MTNPPSTRSATPGSTESRTPVIGAFFGERLDQAWCEWSVILARWFDIEERSEFVIQSAFPIISSPDLTRALVFYRDLLGGIVTYWFLGGGTSSVCGYGLGSSHIGIGLDPEIGDESARQRLSLWAYVDDCDVVVEKLKSSDVPVLE